MTKYVNRAMLAAAIAATTLTAAADARPTARERDVASGQEARERVTTRQLNSQQLASAGAAAMPGAAQADAAMPMAPAEASSTAAPDAATAPVTPTTEATPATGSPAAVPPAPQPPQ